MPWVLPRLTCKTQVALVLSPARTLITSPTWVYVRASLAPQAITCTSRAGDSQAAPTLGPFGTFFCQASVLELTATPASARAFHAASSRSGATAAVRSENTVVT